MAKIPALNRPDLVFVVVHYPHSNKQYNRRSLLYPWAGEGVVPYLRPRSFLFGSELGLRSSLLSYSRRYQEISYPGEFVPKRIRTQNELVRILWLIRTWVRIIQRIRTLHIIFIIMCKFVSIANSILTFSIKKS